MRVTDSRNDLPGGTGTRAVVMTMGALHEGHGDLIRAARQRADHVTVTIFVNPLQFGPREDLAKYPRTLAADLELCESLGADLVFTPTPDVVYRRPAQVLIDPGSLGEQLEGAARPGHFRGMLTVVAKLLHLTSPDVALFGEKDYQQLTLIRSMVVDLDIPVQVVGVPTRRDPDGLAMSSRNRYLSADERERALAISRALKVDPGTAQEIEAQARAALGDLDVDYAVVRSPDLGDPTPGLGRLLIAAHLGTTRLIDNAAVEVL